MKKVAYFLVLIALLSGAWFLQYSVFGTVSGSEIKRVQTDAFSEAILIHDPDLNDSYLYLVFPSGEASNTFDEGLAHYVEHLAWLSANGGDQNEEMRDSNAWTNHFSTGYWLKAASDDLANGLKTLSFVAAPLNLVEEFALEERGIVLREYDFRVAERPLFTVYRDMDLAIYGNGALARSVIGEPDVIAEFGLDTALSLHEKTHSLSEATLLVFGDLSVAQLEAALKSLPIEEVDRRPSDPDSIDLADDGVLKDRVAVSIPELSEDTFLFRKLVPLEGCATAASCEVLVQLAEDALGSSLPGGLAGPLRYDQFVARSFAFSIAIIAGRYVEVSFVGVPDANISLERLEDEFLAAFQSTLLDGFSQETFDRVRSRLADQLDGVLERDRPSYNRDLVLEQLMSAAPIFTLDDKAKAVEDVRLEDVNIFLSSLLVDGREVTRLVSAKR